jgi:hypothetical protein
MSDVVVTFPNRETIIKKLAQVDVIPYMAKNIHPKIAELAGEERSAHGIAFFFFLLITDYMAENDSPNYLGKGIGLLIPNYIDVLVDDVSVAQEAKQLYLQLESNI